MDLCVRPARIALALVLVAGGLTAAHVAGLVCRFGFGHDRVFGLVPLFDLDRENNIPSLVSALFLLICSGLLALQAVSARQNGRPDYRHRFGLAALFFGLAIDENFALHERMIVPLQGALGASGYFHFAWVIPYSLVVLALGLTYLQFLLNLPAATRRRFMTAAVVYLSGALGMEMIGGSYYEKLGGVPDLAYALITTVEELFEMAGVILFIHALLAEMAAADLRILFLRKQSRVPGKIFDRWRDNRKFSANS